MKNFFLFCLMSVFLYGENLVSVSIPPQAFFVQKIAGDTLKINTLITQNSDEHTFELKPSLMKELEKSDIYFTIGLEFEKSFGSKFKENFKNLEFVDMQKNIKLKDFDEENSYIKDFSHKHSHKHKHQKDIHTWLNPLLVKTMANTIYEALSQKYPQNKALYEKNLENFLKELDALNAELQNEFKDIKQREFVVYHPSWGYFASAYKLVQIPVEIDAKEPKIKDLQRLISFVKQKKIQAIFVQPAFPENAAKTLAKECDARLIYINHLAFDWENELKKTAKALALSLR
ncbi:MAG: zinc ABC transporter substrate-binding protein [Campylobacter sp.]|nr:zinc ABC transporter substrate-binding protein [Campylobacter sp.]